MNLREEMTGNKEYCVVKILVMVTHSQTSFGRSVEGCVFYYCVVFDGELGVYSIGVHLCAPMVRVDVCYWHLTRNWNVNAFVYSSYRTYIVTLLS